VEETFSVKAVHSSQIPGRTCEIFDLWNNRLDQEYGLYSPADTLIGTYTRRIPRYVQTGQLFEITMQITNDSTHTITITDILNPENFKLVYGTTKLVSSHQKEIITGRYVARAITGGSITGKSQFDAQSEQDLTETENLKGITVTPFSIKDQIWRDFVKIWRTDCPDGPRKEGVILAGIDVTGGKVKEPTPTPFPKSVVYDTALTGTLLECLRDEVMALENQTMKIKERIAPSKITLSATPTALQTNGSSVITTTVKNDQGHPLSGIPVNLITTLGTISPSQVLTGEDGHSLSPVTLAAGETAGTATVIAHTTSGIGVIQVQITSGTPNIGTLSVDSTPQGAAIELDGVGKGNTSLHGIVVPAGGPHTVKLTLANYDDYTQSVTITAQQETKITATLTKKKRAIHVTSTPTGATISLDGNLKGTTEATLPDIPVGLSYTIKLTKTGYADATKDFTLEAGTQPLEVAFTLTHVSPTGTIRGKVTSEDGNPIQGATVTLKGAVTKMKKTGIDGSYTFDNVPTGTYTGGAKASGYIDSPSVTITFSGASLDLPPIVLKKKAEPEYCTAVGKLTYDTYQDVVLRHCASYGEYTKPGEIYSDPEKRYTYRDASASTQPSMSTVGVPSIVFGKGTVKEPKTKPEVTKKQVKKKKKTVP
jgi:hypothetical protein